MEPPVKVNMPSRDDQEKLTEEFVRQETITEEISINQPISSPQEQQQRVPYAQRLQKSKLDKQFSRFLDVFKKLHINIPFVDALEQMRVMWNL